jgi:hypothetical protein
MYRFFITASRMDVVQNTYNSIAEELKNYQAVRDDLAISFQEKQKKVAKLQNEWEQERQTLMNRLFRGVEKADDSSCRSAVDVNQSYSDAVSVRLLIGVLLLLWSRSYCFCPPSHRLPFRFADAGFSPSQLRDVGPIQGFTFR